MKHPAAVVAVVGAAVEFAAAEAAAESAAAAAVVVAVAATAEVEPWVARPGPKSLAEHWTQHFC